MGRKTGKTKSGRAINPADALRKEMRKKEIKKNKKVRDVVRAAIIKSKDPRKVVGELEELEDQIRFAHEDGQDGLEKSLREKKIRLEQTLAKVTAIYKQEHPEKFERFLEWQQSHERRKWVPPHLREGAQHWKPRSESESEGEGYGEGESGGEDDNEELDVDFDVDAIPVPEEPPPPTQFRPPTGPPPGYGGSMAAPPINPAPRINPAPPLMGMAPPGVRPMLPPGPPPGLPPGAPPGPPPGMPPGMMPPGPPPGLPPKGDAAAKADGEEKKSKPAAEAQSTISAAPQIRNFKAEAVQFVPTSVRVRRPETGPKPPAPRAPAGASAGAGFSSSRPVMINPAPRSVSVNPAPGVLPAPSLGSIGGGFTAATAAAAAALPRANFGNTTTTARPASGFAATLAAATAKSSAAAAGAGAKAVDDEYEKFMREMKGLM